jgi:hypothetical protein
MPGSGLAKELTVDADGREVRGDENSRKIRREIR